MYIRHFACTHTRNYCHLFNTSSDTLSNMVNFSWCAELLYFACLIIIIFAWCVRQHLTLGLLLGTLIDWLIDWLSSSSLSSLKGNLFIHLANKFNPIIRGTDVRDSCVYEAPVCIYIGIGQKMRAWYPAYKRHLIYGTRTAPRHVSYKRVQHGRFHCLQTHALYCFRFCPLTSISGEERPWRVARRFSTLFLHVHRQIFQISILLRCLHNIIRGAVEFYAPFSPIWKL